MPLGRGERIGEAYVRILMDGEGIGDDIIDELEGSEADIKTAGAKHSKEYRQGWKEQMEKGGDLVDLEDALLRGSGRMDAIAKQVAELYSSNLRKRLRQQLNDSRLGDEVFQMIVGRFSDTGNFSGLERDLIHFRELSVQATENIMKAEDELQRKRVQDARDYARLQDRQGREFLQNLRNMQDHYERIVLGQKASKKEILEARDNLKALNVEAARFGHLMGGDGRAQIDQSLKEMERGLTRSTPMLDRFNDRMDVMIPTMSRLFGKGSRNNFLNFFGSMTGNILRIVPAMGRMVSTGIGMTKLFFEGAKGAASFAEALRGGFGAISSGALSFGRLAAGAAASGIALVAIVAVVGVVTAAMSLLLGVVTALAASLTFALVAAVSALAAVMLPIVAVAGAIGLAFVGMDEKAKKLVKESLKPLGEEFKKLGAEVRKGLFDQERMSQTVEHLRSAFSKMGPLFRGIGTSISKVGLAWAKAMDTKMFADWQKHVGEWLNGTKNQQGAIEKLGEIAENVLGGMGGLFEAMIPFMTRVLDYLVRTTQAFQDWANSSEGQDSIAAFFERAEKSLASVWGFLKSIGGLLKTVFTAGQDTGDSIFDSMAKKIREWTQVLKDNPDILKKWFADAKEFASQIGKIVTGVGKLIDALDNPVTRTFAKSIGLIGDAFGVIAPLISPILGPVKQLLDLFTNLSNIKMPDFGKMFSGLNTGLENLSNDIMNGLQRGFGNAFAVVLNMFAGFIGKIGQGLSLLGKVPGFGWADRAGSQMQSLANQIRAAADDAKNLGNTDATPKVDKTQIATLNTLLGNTKTNADKAKGADATPKTDTGKVKTLNDALSTLVGTAVESGGKDATPKTNQNPVDTLIASITGVKTAADGAAGANATPAVGTPPGLTPLLTGLTGIKTKAGEVSATTATVRVTDNGAIQTFMGKISGLATVIKNAIPITRTITVTDNGTFSRVAASANQAKTAIAAITPKTVSFSDGGSLNRLRANAAAASLAIRLLPRTWSTRFTNTFPAGRTAATALSTAVKAIPKTWKTTFTHNFNSGISAARSLTAAIKSIPTTASTTHTITTVERTVSRARGGIVSGLEPLAAGGFANFRQRYGNNIIGESGREAIVPLDRPLSLVDPSVRDLAAFAQGVGGAGGISNSKVIDASGWTIQTDTADPHAVAKEVLNEMTGRLL